MSEVFKALSDDTRRQILKMLREEDMTAGAIASRFTISKPSISHHLSTLKASGLVNAERRGQELVYSLDTTVFQEVLATLLELFGERDEK
ncbi:MAG: autorepressor SdpR family transcription factor [Coriobacteriia bacterium]